MLKVGVLYVMTSSSEALKNVLSGRDGSWRIQRRRGRFNGIRVCLIVSRGVHALGQHSAHRYVMVVRSSAII